LFGFIWIGEEQSVVVIFEHDLADVVFVGLRSTGSSRATLVLRD
jgi:hypothetical protein